MHAPLLCCVVMLCSCAALLLYMLGCVAMVCLGLCVVFRYCVVVLVHAATIGPAVTTKADTIVAGRSKIYRYSHSSLALFFCI